MKIFCIKGNYGEESPRCMYLLPDSTVIKNDKPFFLPPPEDGYKAYLSAAVRIDRLGKTVKEKFASRYYNEATAVVSVVNEHLLADLRSRGLPWERAVSFDRSLWLGDFVEAKSILESDKSIEMFVGGEKAMEWKPDMVKESVDRIIEWISADMTLKIGDIVVFALPWEGVTLGMGDDIDLATGGKRLFTTRIR